MENPTEDYKAQQASQTPGAQVPAGLTTQKRDQDGAMIFLSYFGIFALIPFLTVKDSDFVRWHAKQGLTLTAGMVAIAILAMIIGFIPVIGMIALFTPLLQLGLLVIDIVAMVKAFGGERWRIPLIADLSEKW